MRSHNSHLERFDRSVTCSRVTLCVGPMVLLLVPLLLNITSTNCIQGCSSPFIASRPDTRGDVLFLSSALDRVGCRSYVAVYREHTLLRAGQHSLIQKKTLLQKPRRSCHSSLRSMASMSYANNRRIYSTPQSQTQPFPSSQCNSSPQVTQQHPPASQTPFQPQRSSSAQRDFTHRPPIYNRSPRSASQPTGPRAPQHEAKNFSLPHHGQQRTVGMLESFQHETKREKPEVWSRKLKITDFELMKTLGTGQLIHIYNQHTPLPDSQHMSSPVATDVSFD